MTLPDEDESARAIPPDLPREAFGRPLEWTWRDAYESLPAGWRGGHDRPGAPYLFLRVYESGRESGHWQADASLSGVPDHVGLSGTGDTAQAALVDLRARLLRAVSLAEMLGVVPAAEPMVRAALDALNHPAVR